MNESKLRPRVFVAGLIQLGDVVLTTTPEPMSQTIRKVIGADISHAMICVGKSSVIDSTGDGVHARNLDRLILEPGCAGYVLRPVEPLTTDQLHSVISFARAAVGTRYSMTGAAKSVLAGFVAGRRQFCSRLVAQAYRDVGVNLVSDADFCHPGEFLKSAALVEVPNVLRNLSAEEEADWREDIDNVQAMRDSTNVLLREARKLFSEIESLNDIDAYLVEHQEGDAHLVQALRSSRYLELWRDEFERNSWQYHVAMMEGHDGSAERKQRYCEELLANEKLCQNRFVLNHAGYVTVNALHPRQYFALKIELYDLLTQFHSRRIRAATTWLERRGLLEPAPPKMLRPHTPEWFASLREWNPKQAAMTEAAIKATGSSDVCSVCADEPVRDYAFVSIPAAGPGTFRLCDDCFCIQSIDEPMKPF
ncbi:MULTISPECIES: YiiX/YebB-like N1pC/P60 family cysteine hydrolase [unclassified Pseudomonas]|uniref:YiiX/YebB-like N1pC/P60 family cysteine hydrolase n=1 Tax=unclassified Pseudomonas TaxID=196821 RepID=UPI001CBF0B59|nr:MULTISPECIES: YiiX/YebB-like N1pC/P60 family cysteine hydrolase [unclassified Pseudomonas]